MARAKLASAKKAVELADVQVAKCVLEAPVDATVLEKSYEVGETALPGASILKLGRPDRVHTWVYVPNEKVGRVDVGRSARLVADTYSGDRRARKGRPMSETLRISGLEKSFGAVRALRGLDLRVEEGEVYRGEARAALVIPRGHARALARGEEAAVQLLVDGTNANDASIALGHASELVGQRSLRLIAAGLDSAGALRAEDAEPPVAVRLRNWFNPALRSQWYLVPGLIAVILAMVNTLLMALTVSREWERGTMEQLLVTPVRRLEIALGKLVPYFFLGLGQLVLVAASGVLLFDVPLKGSPLILLGASSLFLVAALAQGLLISVVVRNQQVAIQASMLSSILPSLLLSGFLSPIASMPAPIRDLTYLVPARFFLVVLRGLFLKDVSLEAISLEAGALAAFAAVLLTFSVLAFKTRLD
ncbi:MAG: ABC transporter permease [Polyangia bacterium]